METFVLFFSQLTVFGGLWLLGLPGLLHPHARKTPREYLGFLTVGVSLAFSLAFTFAMLGLGAAAWSIWVACLAGVLAVDIQAVRSILQARKALRTYPAGKRPGVKR